MASQHSAPIRLELSSLPNELVLQVFQQLKDTEALRAVACTCSKFNELAEICLYSRAICTKRATVEKLVNLCQKDPKRAAYVRDVQLLYSTRHYDFLDAGPVDLSRFPCLRSFVSESPFCNDRDHVGMKDEGIWRADMLAYFKAFEQSSLLSPLPSSARPLDKLRSVTLHWTSGLTSRFWETTSTSPLFLLPELRKLTISCVKIKAPEGSLDTKQFRKQTNLHTLAFIESAVSPEALEQILSYPRALKELTLLEVDRQRYSAGSTNSFLKDNIEVTHRALEQQSECLESLSFSGHRAPVYGRPDLSLNLSNMHALKYLQLSFFDRRIAIPPPRVETFCLVDLVPRLLRLGLRNMLVNDTKIKEFIANCVKRSATLQLDLRFQSESRHRMNLNEIGPSWDQPPLMTIPAMIDAMVGAIAGASSYTLVEHPAEGEAGTGEASTYEAAQDSTRGHQPQHLRAVPVRLRVLTSKHVFFKPPYLHTELRPRWVVRYDSGVLASPYHDDSHELEDEEDNQDKQWREVFRID